MTTGAALENIKVSVKDGKSCQKILKVSVSAEQIRKEYDLFYRSVAPKARIPGFRQGKAPRNILEMHFGREAKEEVTKNLISESFRSALQETGLAPLVSPRVENVQMGDKELKYEAHIEVRPKIKLSRVKGLSAKKETAKVEPKELEDRLERMRESLAQYKAVEDRGARMGDFVIADYVCRVDGKEVENRSGEWFELKQEEFLKGFSTQLEGVKPNDKRDVKIQFPADLSRKDLAGKEAVFEVVAKELKEKQLPKLDDEMAKEAGDYASLEELKKKLSQDILTAKEHEHEAAYENALLEELVKHNKLDLPQGLVQRRLEHLVDEARNRFMQQGASEEAVEKAKTELTKDLEKEAARQVHIAFLLDEIATQENLDVKEEDLKKKYDQLAERYRQPAEQIEKIYGENENARQSLHDQIRNEKSVQFIKDNAKQK